MSIYRRTATAVIQTSRSASAHAVSVVALGAFFLGIRQQAAIGDKSFLTSMIPHHAGAILMCERAPIQDAEIKKLCSEIISNQQREIDQMKSMLARLI